MAAAHMATARNPVSPSFLRISVARLTHSSLFRYHAQRGRKTPEMVEHECRLRGTDRGGPCVLAGDATVVPRVSQHFGRDVGLRAVQGPRFPERRWPRTVAV